MDIKVFARGGAEAVQQQNVPGDKRASEEGGVSSINFRGWSGGGRFKTGSCKTKDHIG